jgi:UDP-3-O-[3-hydroxymyristoyl] N-acetylglucosamine deacetylase
MPLLNYQRTIAKVARCSGIGLQSGRPVNLTIKPAPVNHGIKFVRSDLPNTPVIPARFNCVVDSGWVTVIGTDGVIVSSIEHLMASLAGFGIDNALIELDAYELPMMDGSAGPFTKIISEAGVKDQETLKHFFVLKEPIELKKNGKFVGAFPDETFKITCTIEIDHPRIQKQTCSIEVLDHIFECEISHARTFGFLHEVEDLKKSGLIHNGSPENAVILDQNDILNQDGLRFENEFARHQLLDCIGDFSLLGMPILAHIVANKSDHAFNYAFLEKFFSQKESWETQTFPQNNNSRLS